MAYIIRTDEVFSYIDEDSRYRRGVETTIKSILATLKESKTRESYSHSAPNLDFSLEYGKSSRVVGEACGALWHYCQDNDLPWINMLVVRKEEGIPMGGVMAWYENKFGSLINFDLFCMAHADIAELMLRNGCIVIQ